MRRGGPIALRRGAAIPRASRRTPLFRTFSSRAACYYLRYPLRDHRPMPVRPGAARLGFRHRLRAGQRPHHARGTVKLPRRVNSTLCLTTGRTVALERVLGGLTDAQPHSIPLGSAAPRIGRCCPIYATAHMADSSSACVSTVLVASSCKSGG
jgi:hypothetical protein